MEHKLNDLHYKEIKPHIYWLGYSDPEAGFSNNPYLILDETEGVLIDPGPGHPLFRDLIILKLQELCPPEYIRYVILHNQNPDVCGILPFIESYLHPDVVLLAHPYTALFIPYYGVRSPIFSVGDGDRLQLSSGRTLRFIHLPYLYSAGSMATYDEKTQTLFSSDLFGQADSKWPLYASKEHLPRARDFLETNVSSRAALESAKERLSSLSISALLPRHGSIIEGPLVYDFLSLLSTIIPGKLFKTLNTPLSPKENAIMVREVREKLRERDASLETRLFTEERFTDDTDISILMLRISHLKSLLMEELVPSVIKNAERFAKPNPLVQNRIHTAESLKQIRKSKLLTTIHRKILNIEYAMGENTFIHTGQNDHQLMASEETLIIMFIDIRHFTAWSENKPPEEIVSLLSYQYETIGRILSSHSGRINKIMGDGVLAYFPETAAERCLSAACDIQKVLTNSQRLLPAGIGIAAGRVVIGDLGEQTRLDFTVIGAAVNHAARMCSLTDGGEIALSGNFFGQLDVRMRKTIEGLPSFRAQTVRLKVSDPKMESILITASELSEARK